MMPERRLILRAVMALLAAMAGLALVSGFIRRAVNDLGEWRDTGMPTEKLRQLRDIASEVDVLVLGSSRLLHGFSPVVFDEEMARNGRTARSYNLSLQRLLLWEQEQMLQDALSLPGLRPRLVLLEPAVGLGIAPENFTHARTIAFETPAAWARAVTVIAGSERPLWHQAWNITTHTIVLGLNLAHYGAFNTRAFPDQPAEPGSVPLAPANRGFVPLAPLGATAPAASEVESAAASYRADHVGSSTGITPLPAALRTHFLRLKAAAEARGARVVFVQPPALGFTTPELRSLTRRFAPDLAKKAEVWSFLDPDAHPELFTPRLWSDYNHLNAEGAKVLSRELARRAAEAEPRGTR